MYVRYFSINYICDRIDVFPSLALRIPSEGVPSKISVSAIHVNGVKYAQGRRIEKKIRLNRKIKKERKKKRERQREREKVVTQFSRSLSKLSKWL